MLLNVSINELRGMLGSTFLLQLGRNDSGSLHHEAHFTSITRKAQMRGSLKATSTRATHFESIRLLVTFVLLMLVHVASLNGLMMTVIRM